MNLARRLSLPFARLVRGRSSRLPPLLTARRGVELGALIGFALLQAVGAGLIAFATRDVFAALRSGGDLPETALGVIVGAGIAVAGLRYGERVVAERLGQEYSAALRSAIFLHLSRVPSRTLAGRRVGHLSMRFVGDLSAVRNWISLGLARLISAAIVLPATLLVLYLLSADLAVAAGLPIAVGLLVMALLGPQLGGAHKRLRSRRARLAADMTERVVHAPELRLLGRIETERRHLAARTASMVRSALARARGAALLRMVPDVLAGVCAGSVLLAAFRSDLGGAVAAGALAAIALAVQQLRDLAGVWDRNRAYCAARERCEALLRTPTVPRPVAPDDALEDSAPPLRFCAVTAEGLGPIEAGIGAGRKVALVGGNGAGKSTLIALAAGLDEPASGAVTVSGRPVTALRAEERRRMIAYSSGRSPILAGSLRRALTMGAAERPPDEAILACARGFGLGAVLERLGGLDGKVAEAGRNLSAGEVQRVLLTRVALANARLILLDEPEDALDPSARTLVADLVLTSEATALVVTHDLRLAARFDEVWVMEDGALVAAGPPDDPQVAQRAGLAAAAAATG